MRTSIEIPDALLKRARTIALRKKTTVRALVLEGLQRVLDGASRRPEYRLEDCSTGEGGLVEGLGATEWDEIRARSYEGRGG